MGKTKDIREAVEAELAFDPRVDATNITVKNMNGEVALNGTVPSFPQYLGAAAAARRVAGVTNVDNHLEVVLPPGDYRDDAILTTMANDALALNLTVPDGVEATARNGNLRLTSTVACPRASRPTGVAADVSAIKRAARADRTNPPSRTPWTATRYSPMTATCGRTPAATRADRPRPTWAEHDAALRAAWRPAASPRSWIRSDRGGPWPGPGYRKLISIRLLPADISQRRSFFVHWYRYPPRPSS